MRVSRRAPAETAARHRSSCRCRGGAARPIRPRARTRRRRPARAPRAGHPRPAPRTRRSAPRRRSAAAPRRPRAPDRGCRRRPRATRGQATPPVRGRARASAEMSWPSPAPSTQSPPRGGAQPVAGPHDRRDLSRRVRPAPGRSGWSARQPSPPPTAMPSGLAGIELSTWMDWPACAGLPAGVDRLDVDAVRPVGQRRRVQVEARPGRCRRTVAAA